MFNNEFYKCMFLSDIGQSFNLSAHTEISHKGMSPMSFWVGYYKNLDLLKGEFFFSNNSFRNIFCNFGLI